MVTQIIPLALDMLGHFAISNYVLVRLTSSAAVDTIVVTVEDYGSDFKFLKKQYAIFVYYKYLYLYIGIY